MAYKALLSPAAKNHLEEVLAYYLENASKKVAMAFLQDYKRTLSTILKVRYFQVYYANFHGRMMKKFPYILLYTIHQEQKTILIKAIFHTAQDTKKQPKT